MFVHQHIRTLGLSTEQQDMFHQTLAALPISSSRWTSAWFYDLKNV